MARVLKGPQFREEGSHVYMYVCPRKSVSHTYSMELRRKGECLGKFEGDVIRSYHLR